MEAVFLKLVGLSVSASIMALIVVLVRLIFRKAPKWVFCLLWGLVALRLVVPFSVESAVSLMPAAAEQMRQEVFFSAEPAEQGGTPADDGIYSQPPAAPGDQNTVKPAVRVQKVLSYIWLAGAAGMLCYAIVTSLLLRRKLRTATLLQNGVRQSELVDSPFVLGIFRPVIYIPYHFEGDDFVHVIAHERAHIKRRDHLWKPLGFLILSVYWFDPVIWLAYILLCRDIEAACDEKVAQTLDTDALRAYSAALLRCSVHRGRIAACPLAFGETDVKQRIRNVMNYKKPTFWLIAAAVALCAVVAVCCLTDPYSVDGRLAVSMDMAVAEHNQSKYSEGSFDAADYDVIGVRKKPGQTTVYAWVLWEEYVYDGEKLTVDSGSHIPTAITFDTTGSGDRSSYDVIEYWTPRDGSLYAPDIRDKFPIFMWRRAFDVTCITEQEARTRRLAEQYYGIADSAESRLDYKNACAIVRELETVDAFYCPPTERNGETQVGRVDGAALAEYLLAATWKKRNAPREYLPSPGSVEFCISEDYRITVYEKPRIARVTYKDMTQYYRIGRGDYDEAVKMLKSPILSDVRPMLMIDGKKYMDPYKPESVLPHGYELAGTLTAEQAYNTSLEGTQYYVNPNEPGDFYTYQLTGTPTGLDEVDSENRTGQYLRWISVDADAIKEWRLTLDDVRWLSQKGETLTWSDFERYKGSDIGSGLVIMQYVIDELYEVRVIGGSLNSPPSGILLRNAKTGGTTDIRTGDVDAFIGAASLPYPTSVAHVNWTDALTLSSAARNQSTLTDSGAFHLPVFTFDTREELEIFMQKCGDSMVFDQGYNEIPSFDEAVAGYDDDFFAEHTLVMCYVESSSGSFRFGVSKIERGDTFRLLVKRLNDPETFTSDMAGWCIFIEVPDEDIASVSGFDAVMDR